MMFKTFCALTIGSLVATSADSLRTEGFNHSKNHLNLETIEMPGGVYEDVLPLPTVVVNTSSTKECNFLLIKVEGLEERVPVRLL